MNRSNGCVINNIDKCEDLIKNPNISKIPTWLLAICYDGVTWGKFDGKWHFSYDSFVKLCPKFNKDNLLELRIFNEDEEIFIWRTDSGFSGRRIEDTKVDKSEEYTNPEEEDRILLGDRFNEQKDHFTKVSIAGGSMQAVPIVCEEKDFEGGKWPLRLKLKNYFEKDENTGIVRVAATRLVKVYKEGC